MKLELNQEEKEYLEKVLNHYLGELSGEISQTDNATFRSGLKHEKEVLALLIKKLSSEENGSGK